MLFEIPKGKLFGLQISSSFRDQGGKHEASEASFPPGIILEHSQASALSLIISIGSPHMELFTSLSSDPNLVKIPDISLIWFYFHIKLLNKIPVSSREFRKVGGIFHRKMMIGTHPEPIRGFL